MKLEEESSNGGMKTPEKHEDKELSISEKNGSRGKKTKNYLIDIDILEPYIKFV
jgi:hypothetical protein